MPRKENVASMEKTETKKPATKKRRNKPKTKKTDELIQQIIAYRSKGIQYRAIGRTLGIPHSTVRTWFLETQNIVKKAEIPQLREEQVNNLENEIRYLHDLERELTSEQLPDLSDFDGSLIAKAQVLDSYLQDRHRLLQNRLQLVDRRIKAYEKISKLNGLEAPAKFEVEETTGKPDSLDESIRQLTAQFNEKVDYG